MASFTVNEPHPTVVKGAYMHSGRGGAGNYFRAPAVTPSTGVPIQVVSSHTTVSSTGSRHYFSGRGGAGNIHQGPEMPAVNFEEEYARAAHRDMNKAGHVGRGGAGNYYRTAEKPASDASSVDSHKSRRSSGLWARLSGQSTRA